MSRFRKVISIPGNDVSRINQQLLQPPDSPVGTALGAEEYAFEFDSGYSIQVQALIREPGRAELCAYFYDQSGDCVEEQHWITDGIDRDYVFVDSAHNTYTGVIIRGINTAYSAEQLATYVSTGTHCLFCNADDLHGGPIEVNGVEAVQEMYCPACLSSWNNVMRLVEVRDPRPGEQAH